MTTMLEKFFHSSNENPSNQDINEYALRFKGDKDGKVHKDQFYKVMNEIIEERKTITDCKGNANKKSKDYDEKCHHE